MILFYLVLLLSTVWCNALNIQNKTIVFKTIHDYKNKDGRRRLLSGVEGGGIMSPPLYLYKTDSIKQTIVPEKIISIAEQGTYLVTVDTLLEVMDGGNNSSTNGEEVSEFLPSYKYDESSEELANEHNLLITSLIPPAHPSCQFFTYSVESKQYIARCLRPSVHDLAQRNEIVFLEIAPYVKIHIMPALNSSTYYNDSNGNVNVSDVPFESAVHTILLITDDGLDASHCQFTDNLLGVISNGGYGDNKAAEGSHGTPMASRSVGGLCAGIRGISGGSPFYFGDLEVLGDNMIIPPNMFTHFFDGRDIKVHAASYGSTSSLGSYTQASSNFDRDIRTRGVVTHSVSAGNYRPEVQGPLVLTTEGCTDESGGAPSTAKNVLPVGALEYSGKPAYFTLCKPLKDGRTFPLVWALGVNIRSAHAFAYPPGVEGHADTVLVSGTSPAAQEIAGFLILEAERRYKHRGGIITHETLGRAHAMTVYGTVNIPTEPIPSLALDPYPQGDLANGEKIYEEDPLWVKCFISSPESGNVTGVDLTFVWADVESMPGVIRTLINDFDIMVVTEKGLYYGQDGIHVFEKVSFAYGAPGGFRIIVYPYQNRITNSPANFSMYANGLPSTLVENTDCGSCLPGETSTDGCDAGRVRQCLLNGVFSVCSSCILGYLPTGPDGICYCKEGVFVKTPGDSRLKSACGTVNSIQKGETNHKCESHIIQIAFILSLVYLLVF